MIIVICFILQLSFVEKTNSVSVTIPSVAVEAEVCIENII